MEKSFLINDVVLCILYKIRSSSFLQVFYGIAVMKTWKNSWKHPWCSTELVKLQVFTPNFN